MPQIFFTKTCPVESYINYCTSISQPKALVANEDCHVVVCHYQHLYELVAWTMGRGCTGHRTVSLPVKVQSNQRGIYGCQSVTVRCFPRSYSNKCHGCDWLPLNRISARVDCFLILCRVSLLYFDCPAVFLYSLRGF